MLFQSKQVVQILGIKQSNLSLWIARGLVIPSQKTLKGTGNRNLFSHINVCQIKLFVDMKDVGLRPAVSTTIAFDEGIEKALEEIYNETKERNLLLSGVYLALVRLPKKWRAEILCDVGQLINIYKKDHGQVILLNLNRLIKTIKHIAEFINQAT